MNDEVVIFPCPVGIVDLIWDSCIPHINKVVSIAGNDMSIDSIYENVMNGNHLLIVIMVDQEIISIVTARIDVSDIGTRALYLPVVCGEQMSLWLDDFLLFAKGVAAEYKCTTIRGMTNRDGWLRVLNEHGWKKMYTVITCDVGEVL